MIENEAGIKGEFDYAVIATQANQTSFLGHEYQPERELLNRFVFDSGELYLHRDERVMPKNPKDWSVLSYLMDDQLDSAMFSVWVNPVEPSLRNANPIFQTWNPIIPIAPERLISRIRLERAVVTKSTLSAQRDLTSINQQSDRRVFFCGSWSFPGIPLLESAARSAIQIVRRIGGQNSFLEKSDA